MVNIKFLLTGIVAEVRNSNYPSITKLLESHGVKIISEVSSGMELIKQYIKYMPDILILDIMLNEIDGLEAWRKLLNLGYKPHVIIITETVQSEYLLIAFELGCIDYLLKPVCSTRLDKAIQRGISIVKNKHYYPLYFPARPITMISMISNHKKIFINVLEVIYVEKINWRINKVYLSSGSYETTTTLTQILEQCNELLIKPHRSFIVNVIYIKSIQADVLIEGNYELILSNNKKVPLTRRNYNIFKNKMDIFTT